VNHTSFQTHPGWVPAGPGTPHGGGNAEPWAGHWEKKSSHLTERVSHQNRSPGATFRALDLLLESARGMRVRFVLAALGCAPAGIAALKCAPAGAASRRAIMASAPAAAFFTSALLPLAPAAAGTDLSADLLARLDEPVIKSPGFTPQAASAEPLYPQWLAGRWQCTQTLTSFTTPLGVQFIGAAGRPLSEAEASAAQTRAQIGVPVSLELRWKPSDDGAVEDRAFNAKSRFDAFAGREVVRESRPCDSDPQAVACTFLDFKGPVSQKLLINSLRVARSENRIVASERASAWRSNPVPFLVYAVVSLLTSAPPSVAAVTRGIFARKLVQGDTRSFPPITTDSETIVELSSGGGPSTDLVRGRLRLSSYLQPLDPLFFEARGRSVSLSNYDLVLRRLPD
jgi:hypothetical protein